MKRSFRYWLLVLVYGLTLTAVLLYVRYPAEEAQAFLSAWTTKVTRGSRLSLAGCSYRLPLALQCERLVVADETGQSTLAEFDNVQLAPVWSGLGRRYRFAGGLGGGTFSAELVVAPLAGIVQVEGLELKGVELAKVGGLQRGLRREIRGGLDFSGEAKVALKTGEVRGFGGEMAVTGGGFALRQPLLGAKTVELEKLSCTIASTDGSLQVEKGELRGPQLSFSFAGAVVPRDEFGKWGLELKGVLTPTEAHLQGNPQAQRIMKRVKRASQDGTVPYSVGGSLAIPRFRFGGQ